MPPRSIYRHVPHPHIAARQEQGPPKVAHQRGSGLNARIGLRITLLVGTMWCAYAFTVLALVSLPSAIGTHNRLVIVAWIAQTFFQLVLLPIIIVGQQIQGKAADARAEATYRDAEAVLAEALEIQRHLAVQDERIELLLRATG